MHKFQVILRIYFYIAYIINIFLKHWENSRTPLHALERFLTSFKLKILISYTVNDPLCSKLHVDAHENIYRMV